MARFVASIAADVSLVAVAVIWGTTFPLGKMVLRHLGPFQYLGLRFGLAAALLLPLAWRDLAALGRRGLGAGCAAGAVLAAAYALQTVGLAQTTAGKAGLITGLNVVIVPLLLFALGRRLPDGATAAGVLLAAAGLWLLSWRGGALVAGDALVLGCAAAIAVHLIVVGRYAPHLPPAGFALIQIATVAAACGAAGLAAEPVPAAVPASVLAAVAFMAVAGTLGAYLAQSWAQRVIPPTRTGLLFAVEPVAAVAFGAAWLGEALDLRQAVGAAAILSGVVLGEVGPRRRAAADPTGPRRGSTAAPDSGPAAGAR